ncbi:COG4223 family protein [Lichenifustis flavocetrariae]|uniref:Mitochondrial inner membrane protein n=1 Tax=Lichenifustis flavocetrariae TaxID=2949735 RepID=A0AA42CKK8_9HYPH|nr:hypothetical protein [Lichenifustis flavocetrariae]MCW6509376.1 hypothetical protein [Lichenifustis flavocetrariae]
MGEEDERREERSRSGRRDATRQMRRDAPVIEGKATEVSSPPIETAETPAFDSSKSHLDVPPTVVDEVITPPVTGESEPSTRADEFLTGGGSDPTAEFDRPAETMASDTTSIGGLGEPSLGEQGRPLVPALATVAFLVLLAAVIYLLYQVSNDRSQVADLQSRLAGLEARPSSDMTEISQRISTLESAQAQAHETLGSLSKRVDGFESTPFGTSAQLDKVEAQTGELKSAVAGVQSALAALPKPETDRIDAQIGKIDVHLGEVDQRVSALQNTVSAIPRVDLGPLTSKVDALESRLKPVEAEVNSSKSPQRVAERQAAPMAVTAQAIVAAIETGQAFPQEFKALQVLGADPSKLAPLQTVAASGAPGLQDLQAELAGLRDRIVAKGASPPTGSYLDRIMSGASQLVQVRPLGSIAGDTPSAIVARMSDDIGHDDLSMALAELQKLPETSRTVANGLADRIRLRLEAENAAKAIAANAIGAMAPRG